MPAYTYTCTSCGWSGVRLNVKIVERDAQACECGTALYRGVVDKQALATADHGFQMQAVTSKGRIPGHFGKDAPKKRRWL